MRCAIMQPTYLPWSGYFNLIANVDILVFLDDVQYERRSWQNRNRVLLNEKSHFITVPVKHVSPWQVIKDIEIDNTQKWREQHCKTLHHAYSKHLYKQDITEIIEKIEDNSITKLARLNIEIIQYISGMLGLQPKFVLASDLEADGKRSEHLLNICSYLECDEYLSPMGSAEYLEEDGVFRHSHVKLLFQKFIPKQYSQKGTVNFESHLSVVDVLANLGWDATARYVRDDIYD